MAGDEQHEALRRALEWARANSFDAADYSPERVLDLKRELSISVVIPVKNAAPTVGRVAATCVQLRERSVVDEVLVIDAASADGSAQFATEAGAEVHQEAELMGEFGPVRGKGDALWRSLAVARGDIIVFVDSDTEAFSERFVCGLAGPLLDHPELELVKGAFDRPFTADGVRIEGGGGRVNELVARPLLNTFFPELAALRQPLAGELAARRASLSLLSFRTGYGVEIALLLDYYNRFGLSAIAQSDLGERLNRHQHLHELAPMAYAVQSALLARVPQLARELPAGDDFLRYVDGVPGVLEIPALERPAIATVMAGVADGA